MSSPLAAVAVSEPAGGAGTPIDPSGTGAPAVVVPPAPRIPRNAVRGVLVPVAALGIAAILFGAFLLALGKNPLDVYALIWRGGFGSAFAWQNTLSRAAPLILAALCVAIPARMGLIQIGGEGALALGGLAASLAGLAVAGTVPTLAMQLAVLVAAMLAGGAWIAAIGALKHYRGVNETIASLLLAYIGIALFNHLVEGPFKDPGSLNKPSTRPIAQAEMIGPLPGLDVHWGLAAGLLFCLVAWVVLRHTRYGFALEVVGANPRVARLAGLPVGRLMLAGCFAGGAAAGLAGGFEVGAVHGNANASLLIGYGYTGILVAFVARHHPLAIPLVACLFGGIGASSGLLQRRMDLPDATVLVLQGIAFLVILAAEPLYDLARAKLAGRRRT
jgi:simple sugar transport system permease protein